MPRTAALYVPAAVLLVAAWTRLESSSEEGTAVLLALLALGPALVRPWWGKALAGLAAAVVALHAAFDVSVLDARPRDDERNFFGPLLTSLKDGVLEFYDVTAPFPPGEHPLMHGVVLVAVFGFCLAFGLALAARRAVAAAGVLLLGSAWPLALVPESELRWGAALLAVTLLLLAAAGARPPRSLRPAAIAAAVLVVASLAAAAQPAVAKGEFLNWKRWDPYDKPDDPVGVRYVWDANYGGLKFPKKKTHVLTVEGPRRSLYWRATTLDDFKDDRWIENLPIVGSDIGPSELLADPLLPDRAYRRADWVRAKVTAHALEDVHLVGAATPMRWDPSGLGVVQYHAGNVATLGQPLRRGQTWTVDSYAPEATPRQLARSRLPRQLPNSSLGRYIEVGSTLDLPTFRTPGREARVDEIFASENYGPFYREYRPLYERARQVVGGVRSPYAAVIALETWFRSDEFAYDEQPPVTPPGQAPLVDFVVRTKRGYCQHYAGAMALMLRYLGIPARVAVGFTSGTYDDEKRRFTVTDHNAHAWVEVWFEGWGWLPFDPTPARGQLSGQYSYASPDLLTGEALAELRRGSSNEAQPSQNILRERLESATGRGTRLPGLGGIDLAAERGASLLRLLAVVLLVLAALIVLAKVAVRGSRYLTHDPRRVAGACRSDLADFLRDQGLVVGRSATLAELGETLRRSFRIDAGPFVAAAGEARYGPPARAETAARRARGELRALRRQLRKSLRLWDRATGLLSVRSLGFGAGSRG
jgi:protein-glutamine gamma-glutamyltransferase